MKKILLIGILMLGLASLKSQNESNKWAFGVGVSAIDFSGPQTKLHLDFDEYRGNTRLFVGKYLNPSFNFKADFTFGKIWFPTVTAYPETVKGVYGNDHIYDFGLNIEYKLNNGYILKEDAVVSPYLFTGLGLNSIIGYGAKNNEGSDINTFIPFGLGLNVRFTNWLALNLQTSYKLNLDNSFDYTHHSASLVFNFGGTPKGAVVKDIKEEEVDSDKDGVSDLVDECPFAAGTESMFGCPDTDGDGMGDSRDNCPKVAGTMLNKGCPSVDTDGDGVADDKDSCPKVKGEKRYAGCPDTDGDGIVDKYDKCPSEKGIASNNGCPSTQHSSNISSGSDTKKSSTVVSSSSSKSSTSKVFVNSGNVVKNMTIYFNSGSDVVLSSEYSKLKEVISMLNSNTGHKALIKGYTDPRGEEVRNVNLSLSRATNVWKYLNNKAGLGERSEVFGYGEYNQKTSDDKGNRRVVIEIVK